MESREYLNSFDHDNFCAPDDFTALHMNLQL